MIQEGPRLNQEFDDGIVLRIDGKMPPVNSESN